MAGCLVAQASSHGDGVDEAAVLVELAARLATSPSTVTRTVLGLTRTMSPDFRAGLTDRHP